MRWRQSTLIKMIVQSSESSTKNFIHDRRQFAPVPNSEIRLILSRLRIVASCVEYGSNPQLAGAPDIVRRQVTAMDGVKSRADFWRMRNLLQCTPFINTAFGIKISVLLSETANCWCIHLQTRAPNYLKN